MGLSRQSTERQQRRSRLHPTPPRFITGLALGVILALVLGAFTPLLAQSQSGATAPNLIAQEQPDNSLEDFLNDEGEFAVPSEPDLPLIPEDISDHWAADCIDALARRRALPLNDVPGLYPEGIEILDVPRFLPESGTTWTAAITMLNQSFPATTLYGVATPLETALQLPSPVNVLYTYPEQYYEPDRVITRAEAISALAAKAGLPYTARANELLTASLQDGDRVPGYGLEGVAAALAAEVLVNYPEAQQVESTRPITRGEMAALICQAHPDRALQATIDPTWVARPQSLLDQAQPDPEVRGVWLTNIDSEVLFSKDNLAEGVQRLKALNINTLYPVVWNMGYTQYPSAIAERWLGKKQRLWPGENPRFEREQGDRDMLQELIELAHAEGMTVIPWFEFGFMAPGEYALHDEHPDWFTERQDGTAEIPMGAETFTWMNPFHPQTRRLLLFLIAEVLDNYDVEGIQVDDHLGLPVDMGYDPYTTALYQQSHEGDSPPTDINDPEWMRWRADKVSEFMGDVRQVIDQRRPGALLSVSPNPYPFSYAKYLQDWPSWEAAGWLDEVIVQIYRDDLDRFVWELNKPATVASRRRTVTSIGLLSGLRGRPTDVALLTSQLAALRDRGYAGVSYFFYQSLWPPGSETFEERDRQFKASFTNAVARPEAVISDGL